MHVYRREVIDIKVLQRQGLEAERKALAERIFSLWRPLFAHLADKTPDFHLKFYVEDTRPATIRAHFYRRPDGSDGGLMIVRMHEQVVDGQIVCRLTQHAGVHQDLLGRMPLQVPPLVEMARYRLRHPLRQMVMVDALSSPASYLALYRHLPAMTPRPGRPMPDALLPIAHAAIEEMGWRKVPEEPQIVDNGCVVRQGQGVRRNRPPSAEARAVTAWFESLTGGDPGRAVLVASPLPLSILAHLARNTVRRRLRRGWLS